MSQLMKWIGAAAALAFGWFSDMPSVVRILLIVMAFDILAGVSESIVKKTLSSAIAFNGVAKKAVILIIVALTYTVTSQIAGVDASAPIGQTVAGFYIFVEIVSILEKADNIGVPIPDFLRKALNNLNPDGPFLPKG